MHVGEHARSRLTRLACPECGGALAESVLPQIQAGRPPGDGNGNGERHQGKLFAGAPVMS